MNDTWTEQHIPGLDGRVAVATGANTGLGFQTARMLADHGATVVLALRDVEKGKQAAARLHGDVRVQELDLQHYGAGNRGEVPGYPRSSSPARRPTTWPSSGCGPCPRSSPA